jgi:hypothetical protein
LWALEAAGAVFESAQYTEMGHALRQSIATNFRLDYRLTTLDDYHPTARKNALQNPPYWVAALAPNGYDTRFDMAGNALAEFLNIGTPACTVALNEWLTQLASAQKNWLLPVFYPVIQPDDSDWQLLHNNFAYHFKNQPHHFHNGGCWFIWLGFLGFALRKQQCSSTAQQIATQINHTLTTENPPYTFYEYWATDTFEPGGTPQLCFSAAGAIYANLSPTFNAPADTL